MGRKAARLDTGRREWNSHQRGGWIVLFLWQGSRFTTQEVADLCGMTKQGAQKMMTILEASFPITLVDSKWQWFHKE